MVSALSSSLPQCSTSLTIEPSLVVLNTLAASLSHLRVKVSHLDQECLLT
eukprot:m.18027 g.18027  ORF g.18027 m.18027 type:complete len:50 (-) comp10736_c0_seq1:224-373(-)